MKKRILFIVQLPPPYHGASAMNQYVVQSPLISSGFDCAVLPLRFSDTITDIGNTSIKKLWLMFIFCFRLFFRLVRFRPHLVYYTIAPAGSAFYRDALFNFIIKCFGIKRLLHIHGKGIRENAQSSGFKRACYTFTFRGSHVIILGHSLESDISSVYSGKPFVLNNGIPVNGFPGNRLPNDPPVILYLSNLVRSKGIEIFLECINRLNRKNTGFKAVIAGAYFDIKEDEIQRFLAENRLSEKTVVMGPVYGSQKENILMKTDILVFPTYYPNEAFPVILLEAMQAGLPVVTSDNGAITEIVDNGVTGFVVPMKDVTATEEKLEILVNDRSLRQKMGMKGREKFERQYTINNFEQGLYDIFKQVLN